MTEVWVELDGRRYVVKFDADGNPRSIKQRKRSTTGPEYLRYYYNASYWHHSASMNGKPALIIAAARYKLDTR